eukprot:scaffold13793_cov165-Amphora_coffeaeformis.AAC.2
MMLSLVWGVVLLATYATPANAWTTTPVLPSTWTSRRVATTFVATRLDMSAETSSSSSPMASANEATTAVVDYEIPEDAVITIKPQAMNRLRELRQQQKLADDEPLVLRMGVRSGGCSGMSYVMDIAKEGDTVGEDDAVDEYPGVHCVVDAKSMLYLYGLELDYSNELVGGGFKFINPNAEESCGCGSSFGV